ncbi:MAG TPA: hypothetical protein ENN05_08485 [Deltaproteobacteria bacterium]|nr:hypothetical protein [Deltaproteobacteria bacterium]
MQKNFTHTVLTLAWIALTAGLFSLAGIDSAHAHPPRDVTIHYDLAQQALSATISHKTTFSSIHYIESVTITRNGVVLLAEKYSDQPKEAPITYTYPVSAVAGDVLEVEATCNVFGSKKATITVE